MGRVNKPFTIFAHYLLGSAGVLENAILTVDGETIRDIGMAVLPESRLSADFRTHLLAPGMIDLQFNGGAGEDVARIGLAGMERISKFLAAQGVTGFLPTLITDDPSSLVAALKRVAPLLDAAPAGARPLGIHLEGPFLSPEFPGAHRPEFLQSPSLELLERFWEASGEKLALLTIAPELARADEVIRAARQRMPIVSLGHSGAGLTDCLRAIEAGANMVTHLFNAMGPLHHRSPGLASAALTRPALKASLIADGIHVHPEMIRLAVQSKGLENIVLISDAVAAAGMPDGVYELGNLSVIVQNGVCRDSQGRLAGGTLRMDEAVRNLASWIDAEGPEGLRRCFGSASRVPADLLGLTKKGRIEPGCEADLILLNEGLAVEKTLVAGKVVYDAQEG